MMVEGEESGRAGGDLSVNGTSSERDEGNEGGGE